MTDEAKFSVDRALAREAHDTRYKYFGRNLKEISMHALCVILIHF